MNRTLAAALSAVLVLTGAPEATACSMSRIVGAWQVTVAQVVYSSPTSGGEGTAIKEGYPPGPPKTGHHLCELRFTQSSPGKANVGIDCQPGMGVLARGYPFRQHTGTGRAGPWHQLHRVGVTCEWKLVDLNGHDFTYSLHFAPNGQHVVGQGGDGDFYWGHSVQINGVRKQ